MSFPRLSAVLLAFLLTGSSRSISDPPLGLDAYMPVPEENPQTPAKIALGRMLFFDPALSTDETISCATCHAPERAFTDGRATAVGVRGQVGARNVPTLVNRVYATRFFWDGRALGLEEQALLPLRSVRELGSTDREVLDRLSQRPEYSHRFRQVFGRSVNLADLARALASYERTILSGDAPVDRYRAGDRDALSPEAREGLRIFSGKANCTACHLGPTFTDERFHNTGIAWRPERGMLADEGRVLFTGRPTDRGAFKTPTLREVARTAPYMHDGSFATLADVVEFYDRGATPNPFLDREIRSLGLSAREKHALVAFLEALTGRVREG